MFFIISFAPTFSVTTGMLPAAIASNTAMPNDSALDG